MQNSEIRWRNLIVKFWKTEPTLLEFTAWSTITKGQEGASSITPYIVAADISPVSQSNKQDWHGQLWMSLVPVGWTWSDEYSRSCITFDYLWLIHRYFSAEAGIATSARPPSGPELLGSDWWRNVRRLLSRAVVGRAQAKSPKRCARRWRRCRISHRAPNQWSRLKGRSLRRRHRRAGPESHPGEDWSRRAR